jgi:hypothetical protein
MLEAMNNTNGQQKLTVFRLVFKLMVFDRTLHKVLNQEHTKCSGNKHNTHAHKAFSVSCLYIYRKHETIFTYTDFQTTCITHFSQPAPRNRVLEKLRVAELLQKFLAFYGNQVIYKFRNISYFKKLCFY